MINKELFSPSILKKLTPTSLKLLPHISRYTDHDGTVHMDILKRKHLLLHSNFYAAIDNLLELKILRKKNNNYTFSFAYSYKSGNRYRYVNAYDFMSYSTFNELPKRALILLYYLLHIKRPGTRHLTTFENLYNTSFNRSKTVLYENHYEAFKALSLLLEKQFIQIQIGKKGEVLTGSSIHDITKLKDFLGYISDSTKKKRTSFQNRHHISININHTLVNKKSILENTSSYAELELICEKHGIDFEYLKRYSIQMENYQLRYLIGLKNELYQNFGNAGIDHYREALKKYIHDHSHSVEWYIQNNKMVDFFKNIYVLPYVQNYLLEAFESSLKGLKEDPLITKATRLLLKHGSDTFFVNTDAKIHDAASRHGLNFDEQIFDILGNANAEWLHIKKRISQSYRGLLSRSIPNVLGLPGKKLIKELRKITKSNINLDQEQLNSWAQKISFSMEPDFQKSIKQNKKTPEFVPSLDSIFNKY